MKFTVPVNFTVSAKNADEAAIKMKQRLKAAGIKGRVQEAQADDTSKVKLSDELKSFLDSEIQNNDHDVSGWNTDLNYCLDSARDENNECPPAVLAELEALVERIGGTTTAASLVEGY